MVLPSVAPGDEPEWYRAALGRRPSYATAAVDGVSIAYRAWGEPSVDGLVLVHGGAAHSGWWDHIGPLLTEHRRVIAVDLSGHGDSDRRPSYSLDLWAREILAVAAAGGIGGPPTVVGHSMGGFVSLQAAIRFGSRLNGVVVLDSPVHDITPEEHAAFERGHSDRFGSTPPARRPSPASARSRSRTRYCPISSGTSPTRRWAVWTAAGPGSSTPASFAGRR